MEEEVKGDHPPANLEDAVVEFTKARVQRIAERRARIAEKITARYTFRPYCYLLN